MTGSAKDRAQSIGGLAVRRATRLDEPVLALLRAQNVCVVNTLGPAGTIRSRPVWVDTDGEHVVVNSVPGRTWVRVLERDDRVTCTIVNHTNPYEFASIEGRVVDAATDGAADHIDFLAQKYLGLDRYPFSGAGERRIKLLIRPDRILHMAPDDATLG